jgi:malate permease and related proteins
VTPTLILIGKLAPAFGYVLAGYVVKRSANIHEKILANFLFYVLIPITVFKGALLSDIGHFMGLISLAFGTSLILAVVSRLFYLRFVNTLTPGMLACLFSYLNIGWFGIPIVQAVYGDEGAAIMTAFYVGGMLFGNTIGYSLATAKGTNFLEAVKKLAKIPAIYAVLLALLLRMFSPAIRNVIVSDFQSILLFGSILTSVCGMGLVGMSVAKTSLANIPWRLVSQLLIIRFVSIAIVTVAIYFLLTSLSLIEAMDGKIYLLFGALPIAANLLVFSAKDSKDQREYELLGITLFMSTVLSSGLLLATILLMQHML